MGAAVAPFHESNFCQLPKRLKQASSQSFSKSFSSISLSFETVSLRKLVLSPLL